MEKIKLLLDTEEQTPYSVFQIWCVTDKQALTSHKCYYFYLTFWYAPRQEDNKK